MAEIVVSAFFSMFFEKMASIALNKFARFKRIDPDLEKLKRSLIQIKDLLNDASRKEISDEAVKEWLNALQHLAYDIDDLLDDLATEAMHRELTKEYGSSPSKVRKLMPTSITNLPENAKMHDKLQNITTKLQELLEGKNNPGLSVKVEMTRNMSRRSQTSLVDVSSIVGRDGDKNALLQQLLGDESYDKNFSIVPIVGMGGVGKTTIARLLYDEMQGKDHFEIMAWVCVSDEFDIINISKTILQSIDKGNHEYSDLNMLQLALKEKISQKRFMLVLDDVWSESYTDWEILERPFLLGSPGSKIILTTRKLSLLSQLGYNQPYHLSVLSHDSALSLFCQHALGKNNFDSHLTLKLHGESVVEKCDGLPLALIALGRLLRTKMDEEGWKEVLHSDLWRLGKRDEVLPALRLSYHDLSASLKQLFAYCSLFPKDYVFDKTELVLLWMAEGFLHTSTTSKGMERLGLESFEELLSRSFFQHAPNDESLFVMHDLMNDLATYVAGDFILRLDIEMKKEFRKEALEKHRHMSFVCERYIVWERFKAFKEAKNLRTFLATSLGVKGSWKRFYLSNKILSDLLHELPLLRVLSLSNLRISDVPEFIGSLKHLRYLNLSRTRITHLPENVCSLYNLQTLILFGCERLSKFPKSFFKLKNLRHLDIRDTRSLNKMPIGIGELKSLQTLSKIIIGREDNFAITELKNLEDLQGKLSIWGLGNVKNAMHAREANLSQKRLAELELHWVYEHNVFQRETHDKEVLSELKPCNDTLKQLTIDSYNSMEFPNWVGDPSFRWLTHVSIYHCKECTSLPRLGQLPSLKELFIDGMSKVKVIDWESHGTGLTFPALQILSFRCMSGWKVWSANSGVVGALFPCLQELRIQLCPNLIQVSLESIPLLRVLKVIGCSHAVLTSLVDVASSVAELEMCEISGLTNDLWSCVTKNLGRVEGVRMRGCNEIRYLWESEGEASNALVNLRKLKVELCENLVSLGEKEEDNCQSNLPSLRSLEICYCRRMEHCSCPYNIESLTIICCDSITSVSFQTGGGHKLKSLWIHDCKKLLEDELTGRGEKTRVLINNKSMPMLDSVQIKCWPNVKIMDLSHFIHITKLTIEDCPRMESFSDHELRNLTSLIHLTIKNCPGMDSFPDHELPNLTSLTYLAISNCPCIASFPSGLWPPKLHTLGIGGLKRPISEWGPQNFPPSIVRLRLRGGSSEDVTNFSRLSHLFPSSLTYLYIHKFEKLESLSIGLYHLTSLRHLFIDNCPKVVDLPKTLLPSLLSLRIYECPNLKENSNKRHSYWPLISRVPCFEIDFELQS